MTKRPLGHQTVEGVLDGVGLGDQQRALAEVVEQQAGQHESRTSRAGSGCAEVAHVGVEGLAAGDDQEHRAEGEEAR